MSEVMSSKKRSRSVETYDRISPPSVPEPDFTANWDNNITAFENSYRYLSSDESDYIDDLSHRIHQNIHLNPDLMNKNSEERFIDSIEKPILRLLEQHRALHVESVPALARWNEITYSGQKKGAALYTHYRSQFTKHGLNDAPGLTKIRKKPEVHHLLYKSIYPDLSVESWNLIVASRGGRDIIGQHEGLFHTISAGRMGNIYTTLVPGIERIISHWTDQTPFRENEPVPIEGEIKRFYGARSINDEIESYRLMRIWEPQPQYLSQILLNNDVVARWDPNNAPQLITRENDSSSESEDEN